MRAELFDIDAKTVDLWVLRLDDPALAAAKDGLWALLSPAERARHDRMLVERARFEQHSTRALVRLVLSKYCALEPRAWRFEEGSHGRPFIEPALLPPSLSGLDFNLSHTKGLVVVAVSCDRVVGVDVEDRHRERRTLDIADRFFAPREVEALRALPPEDQPARFVELWTLKEAYIKARGMGLRIPLMDFAFDVGDPEEISIHFEPRLVDDPQAWRFILEQPSSDHQLALAIRQEPDDHVVVNRRDALPLMLAAAGS